MYWYLDVAFKEGAKRVLDKTEVEEALQELDRACDDILDDELPALDKLFDNLDSDGVDK